MFFQPLLSPDDLKVAEWVRQVVQESSYSANPSVAHRKDPPCVSDPPNVDGCGQHSGDTTREENITSDDDRKPAAIDTDGPLHHASQRAMTSLPAPVIEAIFRKTPSDEFAAQPPPALPDSNDDFVNYPASRETKGPEVANSPPTVVVNLPPLMSSKSVTVAKSPPPISTRAKTTTGENTVQKLVPSMGEIEEAKTPRDRKALKTWYERLNELNDYKTRFGHCNVPQKWEENEKLGIVSTSCVLTHRLFNFSALCRD
jgi:hypothetical protein